MDHSYEEIRNAALDVLSGREQGLSKPAQFANLVDHVATVFERRGTSGRDFYGRTSLSDGDRETFREVFWDLFRQGIITLGCNDANREFPFFAVTERGRKMIEGQQPYFFHDVASYEKVIRENVPNIDEVTLLYLKEAMQAFQSGCILSSTVMAGVAVEHVFSCLLDVAEQDLRHKHLFAQAFKERSLLRKLNFFHKALMENLGILPSPEFKEDLDTYLTGIATMIRGFRNEAGHPTAKVISRENCYVLLHLFVPYCKKAYQLMAFFQDPNPVTDGIEQQPSPTS